MQNHPVGSLHYSKGNIFRHEDDILVYFLALQRCTNNVDRAAYTPKEPLATLSIPCLSKQRSIAVLPTEDHCEMSAYHHPYTLKLAHSTSLSPLLSSTAGSIQRSCFPGGGIFRRLVFPFFSALPVLRIPLLTLIMSFRVIFDVFAVAEEE